jgi:hypothetical protein
LERERYQRLTPEELEAKNRKRRERSALAKQKKEAAVVPAEAVMDMNGEPVPGSGDDVVGV